MIKAKIQWNKTESAILREAGLNDKTKLFMATEFRRLADPFVPFRAGVLAGNVSCSPGKVTYNQPYAARMFNGAHFSFTRNFHPLATAHWDRATMSANSKAYVAGIQAFIKR